MSDAVVRIEIAYAAVERQALLALEVPAGTTVRQALTLSDIGTRFPELDLAQCPVGIFGKAVRDPETRVVEAGERIEIYRPLLADPKEARRLRAAKARSNRAG
ncbi:RnfH family protein [Pseudomonas sp. JDS28PS106]|uniref:RnfH family protein n=1 Tax=Pseudomonas sp. JDS28PS106 TaxID=2497235 RepID=UPI002FD08B04